MFRTLILPSLLLLGAMFNLTLVVAGLEELILDELGGTVRDASLFFSIEMIAYIIFAPVWGIVSDRIGRRRALVVLGFLISGLAYVLLARATDTRGLLVLRFIQGTFSVMGWSTLMALVLDHTEERHRGRNMGVMGSGLILGVSLGAPVGGILSSSVDVRAPLWVAALLFFALALGALFLQDPLRHRQPLTLATMLRTVGTEPRLLVPYIFYFVDRYTVGFIVVLLPLYLSTLGVDDPALRGRYLAAFLFPFALLQAFTGRLADRFGAYRPLIIGSLLYGIGLCAVGYSGTFGLWTVMLALGVLASIMFPPAIFLTAQLSREGTRGSAMGGFNVAGSLGFAVGPLVGAWAVERAGYGFAFVLAGSFEIAAAVAAIALLLWWRVTRATR